MKYSLLTYIVFGLLTVIGLSVLTGIYWLNQTTTVLTISNQPMPVAPPAVTRGASAVITANYCKIKPLKGTVRTSYASKSVETFQPTSSENLPVGCQSLKVPVLIPTDLAPDVYRIKYQVTYQINPLIKSTAVFYTQTFAVK